MTIKNLYHWLTRGLAVVGIISILFLVAQMFFNRSYRVTSSYESLEAMDESESSGSYELLAEAQADMPTREKSVRSQAPEELLSDEAIAAEVDQKIIKTGTLDLVVDHADDSLSAVEALASEKGGYVQTSTVREHKDGTKSGSVTIRVPADVFAQTIEALKSLAIVVERETTSAEDVTEQYIDLSARLKNAQAQEARYVKILDVAKTVEEILQIESALGNIRGYIESLQGQLQYLDSLTGFSTITISLSEEPVITVGGKEFRPGTTVKQAAQAVVAIAQALAVAIIWIVIVGIGIGVPLALIVWLVWKGLTRLRKR